eukprot:COSAG06_NODE_6530_length_2893_cov_1.152827_2_plen_131_part_00
MPLVSADYIALARPALPCTALPCAAEIAHVGKYAHELKSSGLTEGKADTPNEFSTFTMPIGGYDRARCDGEKDGFVRIHVGAGGNWKWKKNPTDDILLYHHDACKLFSFGLASSTGSPNCAASLHNSALR